MSSPASASAFQRAAAGLDFRNTLLFLNDIGVDELRDASHAAQEPGRRSRFPRPIRTGDDEKIRHLLIFSFVIRVLSFHLQRPGKTCSMKALEHIAKKGT